MEEPSVLDYIKSKLIFWRHSSIEIPGWEEDEKQDLVTVPQPSETFPVEAQSGSMDVDITEQPEVLVESIAPPEQSATPWKIPWRLIAALLLGLWAQLNLEPPDRNLKLAVVLYFFAAAILIWAYFQDEFVPAELKPDLRLTTTIKIRTQPLILGLVLGLFAFIAFGGKLQFTPLNLFLWILSLANIVWAFWLPYPRPESLQVRLGRWIRQRDWTIHISRFALLMIAAIVLILFFRFYQFSQVPSEMVSDHAEKLLDINDVLNGQLNIFFPRNTGREAFQMYLTAAIALIFKTGLSFTSLKIGTVLAGIFTLPYIYLLGKELANREAGFLAMVMAGIAYWPNVISRFGLRFPLYALFAAPVLYYLIRGLRTDNRNDFIWAGLALGIGLHGYTPMRIVPVVVVIGVAIYLLHPQSRGARTQTIVGLAIITLISLIVFIPLGRYALENPEMFAYRSFTRLGSLERPLPGPALLIFFSNLWNAMTMFFWSDGNVWVHSITGRPALDVVSAALLFAGMVIMLVRYLRKRNWTDLFMLLSIPLLLMPSILSLAFPDENPSLNRTSAALVPVFVIVGIALDTFLKGFRRAVPGKNGRLAAWITAFVLIGLSVFQNYDLVFNQYATSFRESAWNTSEMGQVIRDYADSVGNEDTAWVVAYPYWVDTRLVGINAGYPTKDYAISPDQIASTHDDPRTKLFLVNLDDAQGLETLRSVFPNGVSWTYHSKVANKDFLLFMVPPVVSAQP